MLGEEGENQQGTQPSQRLRRERGRTFPRLQQRELKVEGGSEPGALEAHRVLEDLLGGIRDLPWGW